MSLIISLLQFGQLCYLLLKLLLFEFVCVCLFLEVCTVLFMSKLRSFMFLISILSFKVVCDIIIIVTFVVVVFLAYYALPQT